MRALIVSLLAHACLLFGVVRILPGPADRPAVAAIEVVAMNRTVSGEKSVPPPLATVSAAAPAMEEPTFGNAPVLAPASPSPAPAAIPEESGRRDVPIPPEIRKPTARKLAVSDSQPKDIVVPATASVPLVAEAALTASAAPQSGAGNSSGDVAQATAPVTSSGAVFGQGDGVSADEIRQYRFALGENARRFKRFPALARERGWEGTVEIALDFRHSSVEPVLSVTGPSGRKILDDQALEMLRQAVRQTDLPEGLKGKDFRVPPLEIAFRLEN
ncbi:MAG: energy transducer TonB [Zoogloeaceae bacterium]|nr:energy transducer TonB [Zoogloeaceae bacterium]